MSRQITVDYKGRATTPFPGAGEEDTEWFEYYFDFSDSFNQENFLGTEDDFGKKGRGRYSRIFSQANVNNNFTVPDTLHRKSVTTLNSTLYKHTQDYINGQSDGFYMITLWEYSTALTQDAQQRYTMDETLIKTENFYCRNRPFKIEHNNQPYALYPNYTFELVDDGEETIGETTVQMKKLVPTKEPSKITTFRWVRYDSISDVEDLEDFPTSTLSLNFYKGNGISQLYKDTALSSIYYTSAVALKQNKKLTIKNEPIQDRRPKELSQRDAVTGNYQTHITARQTEYGESYGFLWRMKFGIFGPLRRLYYEEKVAVWDDNYTYDSEGDIVPGTPVNPWRFIGPVNLQQEVSFGSNQIFKITNPEAFHTDWVNDTGMDFGQPTHINLQFNIDRPVGKFYYELGTDLENELSRFTDYKMLIIKRGNALEAGETYTPPSSFTHEISGNKIIVDGEADPYLLNLDDFTYMWDDDVYVPYWNVSMREYSLTTDIWTNMKVGTESPLSINNRTFHVSTSADDRPYVRIGMYGELVDEGVSSNFVSKSQLHNGHSRTTVSHNFSGDESNIHHIRSTSSGIPSRDFFTVNQKIKPEILSATYSYLYPADSLFDGILGKRWFKQVPYPAPVIDYINNELLPVFDQAELDYQDFTEFGSHDGIVSQEYFDQIRGEINNFLTKLSQPYQINPNPHVFRWQGTASYNRTGSLDSFVSRNNSGTRAEPIPCDDITNRTKMYTNPELFSQFSFDDLISLNTYLENIIWDMDSDGIWELYYFSDDVEEQDIYAVSYNFETRFEWIIDWDDPDYVDKPWRLIANETLLPNPEPTNILGKLGPYVALVQLNTIYQQRPGFVVDRFFDSHNIENDDREYYEYYFSASEMKKIEKTRHGPRKSCQEEADIIYGSGTSKEKEYWIAECGKRREIIEKQMLEE